MKPNAADGARIGGAWSRRAFLEAALTATGAFVATARFAPTAAAGPEQADASALGYVRIDADGHVVLTIPKSEMGQGVRTSLALLIAEELEADWERVHVETAPLDPRYGDQSTGGSGSVLERFEPLRRVGAAMRIMLIGAAAERWQVPAASLRAENGCVLDDAHARRASYAELAAAATRQPLPQTPPLKPRAQWTLLGREHVGKDVADIVHGRARYGIDQRRPGMVFASIERPREFGARIERFYAEAALALPGVRAVFAIEPDAAAHTHGGVVVVADTTWAAFAARKQLTIQWTPGVHARESTAGYAAQMEAALEGPGRENVNRIGDADAHLARAKQVIRADYALPFLAHTTMEPMNCTAHWSEGRMTLWAPTQFPARAAAGVAEALAIAPDAVCVNVTLMGGGFGRRINRDYCIEAAQVARKLDRPVQVVWSREDDLTHDFYRPCARHRLEACVDADGYPLALRHRSCDAAIGATYRADTREFGGEEGTGIADTFYRVPHRKSEYTLLESGVPRGWWRAVHTTHTTFAIESFINELAGAAGKDALDYRLALIDRVPVRDPPQDAQAPFDPERMKDCLRLAADKAGWRSPPPPGRGRGLACCIDHLSYSAMVVEVSVSAGHVRVHRVVCAVDCGSVINPNGARAQVEGAIVQGLSATLHERVTIERGGVVETNFHQYPLLRIDEAPAAIETHFVERPTARVTGLGEPALPPLAPALAAAIHQATGVRARELPIRFVRR